VVVGDQAGGWRNKTSGTNDDDNLLYTEFQRIQSSQKMIIIIIIIIIIIV